MKRHLAPIALVTVSLIVAYTLLYQVDWDTGDQPPDVQYPVVGFEDSTTAEANADQDGGVVAGDSISPHQASEPNILDTFPARFRDPLDQLRELGLDTSDEGIRATLSNTSQSTEARYWSVVALGKSQSAGAHDILERLLKNENERDMQVAAVAGLAYVGDSHSLEVLEGTINHHPDHSIRSSAVSALLRNPSQETHDIVSRTVTDQSQELSIRQNALDYLGLSDSPTIANTMRTLLVDNSAELRAKAAVALSRNHPDEAMSHLVSAAQDDNLPIEIWGAVVLQLQEATGGRVNVEKPVEYFTNADARMRTMNEIDHWWKSVNGE